MNEILDDHYQKIPTQSKFAKLSLGFVLLTLFLFLYIFLQIPRTLTAAQGLPKPSIGLVILTHVSCLLGVICASLSVVYMEKWRFKKLSLFLSTLIFILFYGLIIWSKIL